MSAYVHALKYLENTSGNRTLVQEERDLLLNNFMPKIIKDGEANDSNINIVDYLTSLLAEIKVYLNTKSNSTLDELATQLLTQLQTITGKTDTSLLALRTTLLTTKPLYVHEKLATYSFKTQMSLPKVLNSDRKTYNEDFYSNLKNEQQLWDGGILPYLTSDYQPTPSEEAINTFRLTTKFDFTLINQTVIGMEQNTMPTQGE